MQTGGKAGTATDTCIVVNLDHLTGRNIAKLDRTHPHTEVAIGAVILVDMDNRGESLYGGGLHGGTGNWEWMIVLEEHITPPTGQV